MLEQIVNRCSVFVSNCYFLAKHSSIQLAVYSLGTDEELSKHRGYLREFLLPIVHIALVPASVCLGVKADHGVIGVLSGAYFSFDYLCRLATYNPYKGTGSGSLGKLRDVIHCIATTNISDHSSSDADRVDRHSESQV